MIQNRSTAPHLRSLGQQRSGGPEVGRLIREVVLSVGALLGLGCLIAGFAMIAYGVTPLVFRSGSMSPAYPTGAVAFAHSVPAQDVRPGDVVSVTDQAGNRVTHRVVEVQMEAGQTATLVLRGDANAVPDAQPYIVADVEKLAGPVLPYVGYVLTWVQTTTGTIVLFGLVGGLLCWGFRRPQRDARAPDAPADPTDTKSVIGTVVGVIAVATVVAVVISGTPRTLAAFTDSATATSGVFRTGNLDPAPPALSCQTGFLGLLNARVSWTAQPGVQYRIYIVQDNHVVATLTPTGSSQDIGQTQLENTGILLRAGEAVVQLRTIRDGEVSTAYTAYSISWLRVLLVMTMFCGSPSSGNAPLPGPAARVADARDARSAGESTTAKPQGDSAGLEPEDDEAEGESSEPSIPESSTPVSPESPAPSSPTVPPETTAPSETTVPPEATGPPASNAPTSTAPETTTPPAPSDTPLGPQTSSGTGFVAQLISRASGGVEVVVTDSSGAEVASAAGASGDTLRWVDGDLWIVGAGGYTRMAAPGWAVTHNVPLDEVPPAAQ